MLLTNTPIVFAVPSESVVSWVKMLKQQQKKKPLFSVELIFGCFTSLDWLNGKHQENRAEKGGRKGAS